MFKFNKNIHCSVVVAFFEIKEEKILIEATKDEILTLKQIHLAHSAVNESANPRNSMRQSSPLFALAESSGKSPSSLSKLASSNSKSRLKSKWKKWKNI